MTEIVICGYSRSAFTPAKKGQLAKTRPDDLAAEVVKGLIKKNNINPNDIEDLVLGCAFPEAEQGMNLARNVVFLSDLPHSIGGCLLYTSPSPRDATLSRMPSSA